MIDIQKIGDDDDPFDNNIDLETNVTKNTELSISTLMAIKLTENPDEEIKQDYLESENLETDERHQSENPELLKMIDIQKIGDDDDPFDNNIDLETNMMKHIESSSSALVARQLTENPDDMVDTEEKNVF